MIKIGFMGGAEDIGRSMTYVEYNGTAVLFDCGMDFPQELTNFGVNRVVSYGSYIKNNLDKVKGIFITHLHEDHIGGIRRFTEKFNIPIYTDLLTGKYLRQKKSLKDTVKIIEFKNDVKIDIENISIRPFATTHSSVSSFGFEIFTKQGNVILTGDFKLGNSKENAEKEVEKWNVKSSPLILICESTNSSKEGFSTHENDIFDNLKQIIHDHRNKLLVIGTFASNIHRLKNIIKISQNINKPIFVVGRNMEFTVKFLVENGLIEPTNIQYLEESNNMMIKKDSLVLSTGCQGELGGGLYKIIDKLNYIEDKTILFSSSVIPGNEKSVNKLKVALLKNGYKYIENKELYHTSGHAHQGELKTLISSLKPKYFIPVHGDFIAQHNNKLNAISSGVMEENIILPENNSLLKFTRKDIEISPIYDSLEYITNYGVVSEKFIENKRNIGMNGVFIYVIKGKHIDFSVLGIPERCKAYRIGQSFVDYYQNNVSNKNLSKKKLIQICEEYLKGEFKSDKQLPVINIITFKKQKNKKGE